MRVVALGADDAGDVGAVAGVVVGVGVVVDEVGAVHVVDEAVAVVVDAVRRVGRVRPDVAGRGRGACRRRRCRRPRRSRRRRSSRPRRRARGCRRRPCRRTGRCCAGPTARRSSGRSAAGWRASDVVGLDVVDGALALQLARRRRRSGRGRRVTTAPSIESMRVLDLAAGLVDGALLAAASVAVGLKPTTSSPGTASPGRRRRGRGRRRASASGGERAQQREHGERQQRAREPAPGGQGRTVHHGPIRRARARPSAATRR